MILGHVVQQLPLVDLKIGSDENTGSVSLRSDIYLPAHWAPPTVLALVSGVLHAGSHQAVTTQQVSLQALVSEKSELTFLTIERRSVVDHLRVNFNLREN